MFQKITKWLPTVVAIIAMLGFGGTLLSTSYSSGIKEQRITALEISVVAQDKKDKEIELKLDKYINELTTANARLELLLDYFNITDSTRHR